MPSRSIGLLFAFAATASAQDDPFETRLHNVEFITREIRDFPGEDLSLSTDAIGTMITAKGEFSSTRISGDDLIALIGSNVAEDSWQHVSASISFANGILTVTNLRSVQERIARYLTYWRGFFGRMVVIDTSVVSIDPALLAGIRSAGDPDRPAALPEELAKKLFDAARAGKLATLLKSTRLTAHPGQRANAKDAVRRHYVRDQDLQIATASVAIDPIVGSYQTGLSVDLRPYVEPFGNAITLEVRITRVVPEALAEYVLKLTKELTTAVPLADAGQDQAQEKLGPAAQRRVDEPKIELPRLAVDRIRTTLTVRNGETVIAASTFREGRNVLYLLTPTIVPLDEKPLPEPVFKEERLLRLYDVSPLTRGLQNFPGPYVELVDPSGAGGGPLTGATFTLDGPVARMDVDDVVDMVRTKIAPESWGNKRNSVRGTSYGSLVIRQKPDVLREIDRFLNSILSTRAQMITTQTFLIGFKKGARAKWEDQIPALRPGGYFADAEKFATLLEEAAKNKEVRLIEMGEVTSFPQQRVHVSRLQQEAYVADYEPQVSTAAAQHDPIIGVASSGFVLDARPHFIHGADRVSVELRLRRTRHAFREVAGATAGAGALQLPEGTGVGRQLNVTCVKGKVTLAGIETRGEGDDPEEVAIFVRARANLLK